ncbi:hypothetical protein AVEN_259002-1 [Araneus ventricosus]|uniref:Uncharacterized protein n=1 Tax=Araneus ventricosus TaxID=182803 RepID=A0A4Y2KGK8_ARAVE|nr:hypothetical protein AVEN_259002-1 [Araneus ventricosus]
MAFRVPNGSLPTSKENKPICRPRNFDFCRATNRNWTTVSRGQMTRATSELASSSPNFRTTPAGRRLTNYARFGVQECEHSGSSAVSGFGHGALRLLSRDLSTGPPRPLNLE